MHFNSGRVLPQPFPPSVSVGSCLAAVERAVAETSIGAVLPLGRQHSLLNIIHVVIQKLGHLIHIYLPKVLQILLCVTASVSTVLDSRDQVIRITNYYSFLLLYIFIYLCSALKISN